MTQFWNKITKVPFAKSDSEQMKYSILRGAMAAFTLLFICAQILLLLLDGETGATMSSGLKIVWPIIIFLYFVIWLMLGTRFYKESLYIWTATVSCVTFILVTMVRSEASVYRVQVFMTISLLIQSGFLARKALYISAMIMYLATLLAMDNAGIGTFGLAFVDTVVWLFAIAALELIARIREGEAKLVEEERARALHSSRLSTLGETTAFLVHEVTSPLTILNGHLELIRKGKDSSYHVERMQLAMNRALDFMDSVKRMVRANEPNEFEVVQLSEVLKMASDIVDPSLRRKNISLEFDYAEDLELKCQPAEIAQVLINLINNSADAIGTRSNRQIRVVCKQVGNCVETDVIDFGLGIDPGLARKIMKPFFTTKSTGSGIGLSIAQQVAAHHDGGIEIVSYENPTIIRFKVDRNPKFAQLKQGSARRPSAVRASVSLNDSNSEL